MNLKPGDILGRHCWSKWYIIILDIKIITSDEDGVDVYTLTHLNNNVQISKWVVCYPDLAYDYYVL